MENVYYGQYSEATQMPQTQMPPMQMPQTQMPPMQMMPMQMYPMYPMPMMPMQMYPMPGMCPMCGMGARQGIQGWYPTWQGWYQW